MFGTVLAAVAVERHPENLPGNRRRATERVKGRRMQGLVTGFLMVCFLERVFLHPLEGRSGVVQKHCGYALAVHERCFGHPPTGAPSVCVDQHWDDS